MKKTVIVLGLALASVATFAQDKLITKTGHARIFSHTSVEDIEANNYKVISSIDPATGKIVFSFPMQGFEFPKAKMQQHFNSPKFLDTQQFPKAKFKGNIVDMSKVNFKKDGTYEVMVKGDLTMHGVTKTITEKGTIVIKDGKIQAKTKVNIVLADYKIAFEKGKPSKNISKTIEATIDLKF